jgi:hypothetical protein
MGDTVVVAIPALLNPFLDASQLSVSGRDRASIRLANGFPNHDEMVQRIRDRGKIAEVWIGGTKLLPEAKVAAEIAERYE